MNLRTCATFCNCMQAICAIRHRHHDLDRPKVRTGWGFDLPGHPT